MHFKGFKLFAALFAPVNNGLKNVSDSYMCSRVSVCDCVIIPGNLLV